MPLPFALSSEVAGLEWRAAILERVCREMTGALSVDIQRGKIRFATAEDAAEYMRLLAGWKAESHHASLPREVTYTF